MEKLYDFNDIPNKVKMGLDKLFTYTHPKKFRIKRKLLFKKIRKQQRRKTLKYINNSFKKPNSFYSKLLKQILKKNNH
jgi:poly(3-hydroxyalkanoate) synthetase